jgi:DNA-binding transcriptional LysR family regulator
MSLGGTDLNLMVALRALLEEGNVTKAGAKIGKSQPAMSTALARLRRHYQDELLVRVGRDYELTPFAKALVPSVQQTMQCVELALDTGQRFDPLTSRHVFRINASDYAITVLAEPLLRLMAEVAPGIRLDVDPIPEDMHESDHGLRTCDALIGPRGFGFAGSQAPLFRDRFVCVVDPENSRLADGRLTLDDLSVLPHAVRNGGRTHVISPADRVMDELSVRRQIQVTAVGFLPLPFLVAGTDLVAVIPERLALRVAVPLGLRVVEPPFGRVELIETLWWHPDRESTPEHAWLRRTLTEAAASLSPVAADFPVSRPAPQPQAQPLALGARSLRCASPRRNGLWRGRRARAWRSPAGKSGPRTPAQAPLAVISIGARRGAVWMCVWCCYSSTRRTSMREVAGSLRIPDIHRGDRQGNDRLALGCFYGAHAHHSPPGRDRARLPRRLRLRAGRAGARRQDRTGRSVLLRDLVDGRDTGPDRHGPSQHGSGQHGSG